MMTDGLDLASDADPVCNILGLLTCDRKLN